MFANPLRVADNTAAVVLTAGGNCRTSRYLIIFRRVPGASPGPRNRNPLRPGVGTETAAMLPVLSSGARVTGNRGRETFDPNWGCLDAASHIRASKTRHGERQQPHWLASGLESYQLPRCTYHRVTTSAQNQGLSVPPTRMLTCKPARPHPVISTSVGAGRIPAA